MDDVHGEGRLLFRRAAGEGHGPEGEAQVEAALAEQLRGDLEARLAPSVRWQQRLPHRPAGYEDGQRGAHGRLAVEIEP